jgi:hypothetical protein
MTTELKKPVSRVTLLPHRGRKLVVTLLVGDLIEIREKGRRTREVLSIAGALDYAIIQRVAREKWLKKQARKNK